LFDPDSDFDIDIDAPTLRRTNGTISSVACEGLLANDLVQPLDDLLQLLVGNPSEFLPNPLNRHCSYLTDLCPRLFGQPRTTQFKR